MDLIQVKPSVVKEADSICIQLQKNHKKYNKLIKTIIINSKPLFQINHQNRSQVCKIFIAHSYKINKNFNK